MINVIYLANQQQTAESLLTIIVYIYTRCVSLLEKGRALSAHRRKEDNFLSKDEMALEISLSFSLLSTEARDGPFRGCLDDEVGASFPAGVHVHQLSPS